MPLNIPNPNLCLAAGRTRVDISLTAPAGFHTGEGNLNVPLSALSNAIFAGHALEMSSFKLQPAASDEADVTPLASTVKVNMPGLENYEANAVLFRSITNGVPDADDAAFAAVGEKGVVSYWWKREYKIATVDWAAADKGWIYEVRSDHPIPGELSGAITAQVPIKVLRCRPITITA